MKASRARAALVLVNVALLGAIAYLGQHALRHPAGHPAFGGPSAVSYALADEQRTAQDPSAAISRELDPPPPPPIRTTPPPAKLDPELRLLLVSEDRDDPSRSTAIVSFAGGDQRTVTLGDALPDDFRVVHIGVHGDGDERRATLVAERGQERLTLQTERGARP